jgi:predicted amidohydrolase
MPVREGAKPHRTEAFGPGDSLVDDRQVTRMRIAVTQFKVRDTESFDDFAEHVAWHVEGAVWQRAHCVVFPEYFTTELLTTFPEAKMTPSKEATSVFERLGREYTQAYLHLFKDLAYENGIYIVGGTHFYFNETDGRYYNASFLFDPDGGVREQRKTHRAYEVVYNRDMVSPGDNLEVFDTDFGRAGITVCYDAAFPETARILMSKGAEIIFNPSCVFNEWGVERMWTYSAARAIENQCYVVNSQVLGDISFPSDQPLHYEGRSAIHAPSDPSMGPPNGVLVQGTLNEEQVVSAEVDIEKLRTYREEGVPPVLRDRRPDMYLQLYGK